MAQVAKPGLRAWRQIAAPAGPAPYACLPEESRGRLYAEPESPTRSVFQRDRDRIIHSGAFRKLKYKTQVFVYHEGDYYRTRLTHSLEVAQIARSISRALNLNEDLAETVALAHDLGHTPFGHAGEDALALCMEPYGGFSHNDQTLRILTQLEHRYAEFDGLNLTWETLEGVVKHNGPVTREQEQALPATLGIFQTLMDLELESHPSLEAQVAAMSDDIAYNNHDIDDGLRAGLFSLDDLRGLPLVGPIVEQLDARYPGLERTRLVHETIRRMIDAMVTDLLSETRRRLESVQPQTADEVRQAGMPLVAFSDEMREHDHALRRFLRARMYRHFRVNRMTSKARRVVHELFEHLTAEPECLPLDWQTEVNRYQGTGGLAARARIVADYIAGMTDRFATDEHQKLLDPYSKIG